MNKTVTLSKSEDGTYNLLMQDNRGRVILRKRGITFREAAYEIENRMYTEEKDGN